MGQVSTAGELPETQHPKPVPERRCGLRGDQVGGSVIGPGGDATVTNLTALVEAGHRVSR